MRVLWLAALLGLVLVCVAHADTQVRNPTSDGTRTGAWGGGSSAGCNTDGTRYLCINDFPDAAGSTYIGAGSSPPCTTMFAISPFSFASSAITSLALAYYDSEASSGVNTAAGCITVDSVNYCAAFHDPATTITLRTETWTTNPCTPGVAWTDAQVAGIAASCNLNGFALTADDVNPTVRFTSAQLTATYSPAGAAALRRRMM